MKVLVDTCIWSLALRRKRANNNFFVRELQELIKEFRVQMIGSIRQEILSGIRSIDQFDLIKERLRSFVDLEIITSDYERAAEFFNTARMKGVQGANTDFLICAVAERRHMAVFTNDKDFKLFQKCLPLKLHTPRRT